MNKKSIELSLMTILGLVLAALVLIFLFGFLDKILSMFFPQPGAATMANYERLVNEIKNLEDGNEIQVPYYIFSADGVKLVNEKTDVECNPASCLCLCKIEGCSKPGKLDECFSGYEVVIEHAGALGITNDEKRINLLTVRKQPGKITITDMSCKPPEEGKICCRYVEGIKAETGGAGFEWIAAEQCKSGGGSEVPYSYCC